MKKISIALSTMVLAGSFFGLQAKGFEGTYLCDDGVMAYSIVIEKNNQMYTDGDFGIVDSTWKESSKKEILIKQQQGNYTKFKKLNNGKYMYGSGKYQIPCTKK